MALIEPRHDALHGGGGGAGGDGCRPAALVDRGAPALGWNVTASGFAKDRICGFSGGAVPFAKTRADRLAAGDPRLSIEERYGTLEGYVCTVRAAADRLVTDRLLLRADADRTIRQAQESNVLPRSSVSSPEARATETQLCRRSRGAPTAR